MGQGTVGPQHFNLSTPGGAAREKAPYNPHWKFDAKLSNDDRFQYDPKDTKAWLIKVANYFTGQCPDDEGSRVATRRVATRKPNCRHHKRQC